MALKNLSILKERIIEKMKLNKFASLLIKRFFKYKKNRSYFKISNEKDLPKPKTCMLFITMRCNLNCIMCHQKNYRKTHLQKIIKKELNTKQVKLAIDKLKDFGIKKILLTGGEPLLREDIYEILDYITKKGIAISFGTNGTLLDDFSLKKLSKYPLTGIGFSVDGLENTHDKIRGIKGSFKKTIKAIKKSSKKFDVSVNFVLQKENINQVQKVLDLCEKLGVKNFGVITIMKNSKKEIKKTASIFSSDISCGELIKDIDLKQALNTIKNIRKSKMSIDIGPPILERGFGLKNRKLICGSLNLLSIDYNGDILFCGFIKRKIGNILSDQIDKVWNSEEFKKLRKNYMINKMSPICLNCCVLDSI